MSSERLSQSNPGQEHDEAYRHLRDAIAAILGPRPSKEDVRALHAYVDRTLATVEAQAYPAVRALAPGEPGYDLEADDVVAQQESTAEFFAFLDRRPAANDHDANSR